MRHLIEIVIDSAGRINLRIDDWYHSHDGTCRGATKCAGDIAAAKLTRKLWDEHDNYHDADLAALWDVLIDDPGALYVCSLFDLGLRAGGPAVRHLRQALVGRQIHKL